MKIALMVIDMQKAWHEGEAGVSMDRAAEYINEVLPHFRTRKLPVIWVQDVGDDGVVAPGAPGFEIIDSLVPAAGESVVHKHYGNSFNKTDCARLLREAGVDTVVVTGYCAEHCVLSSYRGALDLDLSPVILVNGIASGDRDNLALVQKISQVVSYKILEKFLEG